MEKLEYALRYAEELDWPVLPLADGGKCPRAFTKGVHGSTTDLDQIREWWAKWPLANIGIACGPESGLFVLDIDPRNGGNASLAALAARGYVLPPGPVQKTANGGRHHLFLWKRGLGNTASKLGEGLDTKGRGGYIVISPSALTASAKYEWIVAPFGMPIHHAPLWLTSMIAPPPRPKIDLKSFGNNDIDGLIRRVASEPEGNRNPILYWATCRAEESGSATGTNIGRLIAAACHAGLTQSEAMKTVNSAIARVRNERGPR